jgi:hypothetical protein
MRQLNPISILYEHDRRLGRRHHGRDGATVVDDVGECFGRDYDVVPS